MAGCDESIGIHQRRSRKGTFIINMATWMFFLTQIQVMREIEGIRSQPPIIVLMLEAILLLGAVRSRTWSHDLVQRLSIEL